MYTAAPTSSGSYAVSDSTGKQVATGSSDMLTQYGLSPSNLGSIKNPNDASVGSGSFGQSTPTPSPSLIVTSAGSRTAYNNSVNNMNTGISNLSSPTTSTPSPNGSPTTPNNPQANTTYGTGTNSGAVIAQPQSASDIQSSRISGGTYTGQDGKQYYHYDGSEAGNAPATQGSDGGSDTTNGGTKTNDDGSSSITLNDGTAVNIPVGTDPGLAKEYTDAINTANDTLAQRKSDITAAQATVQNDPAASAALQTISDQYDVLIQQMKDKNKQLVGRANSAVGAFGGLGVMSQNFMNDEMDSANQRVGNLVAQEQDLLMKTSIAYKTGDLKALDAAETAYTAANTAKLTAINDLLSATNKAVAQGQAQQKIDATATKVQNAQDISNSVKGASAGLALLSSQYGVTDPSAATPQQLADIASQLNISDGTILQSQMITAKNAADKASLAATNVNSEIDTREQNANTSAAREALAALKSAGGSKATSAQTQAAEVQGINSLLKMTDSTGTPYIDRDSTSENGGKGYFTVAGYNALINNTSLPVNKFIAQYASYFSPTNLDNYGLTGAQKAIITNSGKTPASTN